MSLDQHLRRAVVAAVRSGGQTGVDRAALDTARQLGIRTVGWCPKGGWAEDFRQPPGLLAAYPELVETPTEALAQRTSWNVRDAHATLIIRTAHTQSMGTAFTEQEAIRMRRPLFILDGKSIDQATQWLRSLGAGITLNVAGPRASEAPHIYKRTCSVLSELLVVNEGVDRR